VKHCTRLFLLAFPLAAGCDLDPRELARDDRQATLFWNSLTPVEQDHLVDAAHFELGKVETVAIRERVVEHLGRGVELLEATSISGVRYATTADAVVVDAGVVTLRAHGGDRGTRAHRRHLPAALTAC
jgi:hypothetical protein